MSHVRTAPGIRHGRIARLVLATTLLAAPVGAQTRHVRALVYLPDNSRLDVANLVVDSPRVVFDRSETGGRQQLLLDEVAAIRVYAGSRGSQYAAIGAGLGVAIGALTAAGANASNPSGTEISVGLVAAVTGATTALIGYVIGAREPRWTPIYPRSASLAGSGGAPQQRRRP